MTDQARAVLIDDGPDPDEIYEARQEHEMAEAFLGDVETMAHAAMVDCGDAIPPELRDAWFDRFCMIAAVELTDDGKENDLVPF